MIGMIKIGKEEMELLKRLEKTDFAKFRKLVVYLMTNGKVIL